MNGILFTPDMHQAIRDNRKTVTRRQDNLKEVNQEAGQWILKGNISDEDYILTTKYVDKLNGLVIIHPRYHVGEVLYVKEAYRVLDCDLRDLDKPSQRTKVEYKLDSKSVWLMRPKDKQITIPDIWHSPLFMPAWAARDFIQIVSVRPEMLILPLPADEVAKDGGETALKYLKECDGKWLWRIEFTRVA